MSAILWRIALAPLLVALMFGATVPKGMMRYADADGMRLVICSVDGPREVVVDADGVLHEAPIESPRPAGDSCCLSLTLAFAGLQSTAVAVRAPAVVAASLPLSPWAVPLPAPARAFASRAPPALA